MPSLIGSTPGRTCGFALTLPGSSTTIELTVLDLRLFEARPLADEATFFVGLVEVARSRAEAGDLPWPAIEEEELDRIKSWCGAVADGSQTSRENVAYVEGMTLLPRLIALADPAYPVIVFSSTGRRVVAESSAAWRSAGMRTPASGSRSTTGCWMSCATAYEWSATPSRRARPGWEHEGAPKWFVGSCEYSVGRRGSADHRRFLRLLAEFAFYAGVGLRTTMGMGQVCPASRQSDTDLVASLIA